MTAQNSISPEDKLRKAKYACDQWGGITTVTFWRWYKKGLINIVRISNKNYVLDSEIERVKRGGAA